MLVRSTIRTPDSGPCRGAFLSIPSSSPAPLEQGAPARPATLCGGGLAATAATIARRGPQIVDFAFTEDQQNIRDAILKHCTLFPDEYWLARDREENFPEDFYRSLADAGWLGIAMPEAYGGSGLGITEAAIMMQAIAESGAGMSGASSVHINIFGLQPIILFGTEAQRQRAIPGIVSGADKACFAVTEPNAGLNTTQL